MSETMHDLALRNDPQVTNAVCGLIERNRSGRFGSIELYGGSCCPKALAHCNEHYYLS